MEKLFKLKEHGTDVKTEIVAGTTTFLSMVYILAVNPSILSASGMDSGAVFTATAVSAVIATLFMAFLCIPMAEQGIDDPWRVALAAVLVEGILFVLLSLCNFREKLVNDVPANLKFGITAGIGLFIAIVGLKGAGVVIGDASTLVAMGDVTSPQFALAIIGLIIVAALYHYNVKGYLLIGILVTWILGMIAQAAGWYAGRRLVRC